MAALISFLVIIVISILVIRVATVALAMTGISRDVARFQALSAFTGVGFTTREAEAIINHPVRRRIITLVIWLGNVGFITTIASLLLTFIGPQTTGQSLIRLLILAAALVILGLLAASRRLDNLLSHVIRRVLSRWTDLSVALQDYAEMLNLSHGYRVGEIAVQPHAWVADKSLAEAELQSEGILVLGITRQDGSYVGAPHGGTRICVGDRLSLYGTEEDIAELNDRLAGSGGDAEHQQAVRDQAERVRQQNARDTYSHNP